ncbi:AI-2E family transporter [Planosporangium flavigriseum]|uniref:AI-2E family transporter n=1 Tax=Planosporangium flavigriseum TaxID=373681 RepID=UPI0031D92F69
MGPIEHVRRNIRRAYAARRTASKMPIADRQERIVELDETTPSLSPQPPPVARPLAGHDDVDVPRGLRVATAWSWRLLVLAAAAALVLWLVGRLKDVLIPVSIALLLTALLAPAAGWLRRSARLPRSLAVAVVLIGGIAAVVGVLTLVVTQFVNSFPALAANATAGIRTIQDSLRSGPLHLSNTQFTGMADAAQQWLDSHRDVVTSSAVTTATTALDVVVTAILVLFTTFFFLRDGRRIWQFLVGLMPAGAQTPLGAAGEASWSTLVSYVRATVLVAFIDAVGIGLALSLLRVQLAFPLAALVFLGAFVPIVGAAVSGAVAVLVALVTKGWVTALIVLAAVILVQQLEGHILQPIIMGRAVAIHPLAIILAITTGIILAGIMGALIAVPLLAVLNTGIRRLISHRAVSSAPAPDPEPDPVTPRPSAT